MKNQLLIALIVVTVSIISCGPPQPEKYKTGGGGGGVPTVNEADMARAQQTRLLFDQMSSVKQLLEVSKAETTMATGCRTIDPRPGKNPFLKVMYFNCTTKSFNNKEGKFSGVETFSIVDNKIVISAPEFQLRVDGKLYDWSRELAIAAKLEDLLSAKGFDFEFSSKITPTSDSNYNAWKIDVDGHAKLDSTAKLESFSADLNTSVMYTRPKWIPARKRHEAMDGMLTLKALRDVSFASACKPVGRFAFSASEGTKTKGVVESDGKTMSDPDRNDPVFHKPEPLPKCE